jgi:hypothetical protein
MQQSCLNCRLAKHRRDPMGSIRICTGLVTRASQGTHKSAQCTSDSLLVHLFHVSGQSQSKTRAVPTLDGQAALLGAQAFQPTALVRPVGIHTEMTRAHQDNLIAVPNGSSMAQSHFHTRFGMNNAHSGPGLCWCVVRGCTAPVQAFGAQCTRLASLPGGMCGSNSKGLSVSQDQPGSPGNCPSGSTGDHRPSTLGLAWPNLQMQVG